jgi:enoyl-CoA hydratase/carnithine racemase
MADEILYENQGQVAIVTINRPEVRNAINMAVRQGLREAWTRFAADDDARVAILTGAGDKAFCAGADLKEMSQLSLGVLPRDFMPIINVNIHMEKPVIAAVNGATYAGGWSLAQMCDLCVASETAVFAISEGLVGRGFPWAAPLLQMIPQRVLLEILMTGKPISAERAREIGFVNHVVPPEELMPRALELADDIIRCAPLTVAAAKEMAYMCAGMDRNSALAAAHHLFHKVYSSADAKEGPLAFREKRTPRWQGR